MLPTVGAPGLVDQEGRPVVVLHAAAPAVDWTWPVGSWLIAVRLEVLEAAR